MDDGFSIEFFVKEWWWCSKKKKRNFFFAKKKKKRRQNRVLLRRQRRGLAFLCPPSQKPREGVVCKRARLLRVRWWWERPRFVSL